MVKEEFHFDQELLIAVNTVDEILVLNCLGKGVSEAVRLFGQRDLVALGFYKDDLPSEEHGIFYWKGTLKIEHIIVEVKPALSSEYYWEGTWHDATLTDLRRFQFDQDFTAKSYQC